jgi:histidyl-tRNA synthetase
LEVSEPLRKPAILKGFRDYLPEQMILRQEVIRRVREVFELHGFDPLDTPAIEYLEILTGKAGENEKLMYEFEDHGGRKVGLRFDLTVPLARVVAMHQGDLALPFKRYHIAPVWRAERPQKGRFREFWQCDADIVGVASMLADAEIISILADALDAIGLPNFKILMSHRVLLERIAVAAGVPEERAGFIYRSVDKVGKIGVAGLRQELIDGGISRTAAESVLDAIYASDDISSMLDDLSVRLNGDQRAERALDELRDLLAYVDQLGVESRRVIFDLSLARGLDYYTGPVFEAAVTEPQVGSVAGGGRYEELIGTFLSRPVSATGVSLGLERIIEVVREFGTLPAPSTTADVFVVVWQGELKESAALATKLRHEGIRTDLSLAANKSVGDQLKIAARKGAALAVIQGPDERAEDTVSLKDLKTGEQVRVQPNSLASEIRKRIDPKNRHQDNLKVARTQSPMSMP